MQQVAEPASKLRNANDAPNINFTSNEDSQTGSCYLKYKFIFIFISHSSTINVDLHNDK